MSDPYSVYAVHEAEKPKWLPGEDYAAVSAHAMTLLLVVGINIHIHHVFQRRKGAYFWAMQIGSIGCLFDVIGLLVRNFVADSVRVWPLYTLLATVGWATYTVAQLVVLYSRLHLVSQNLSVQRGVYMAIAIASPILIITDWVTTWAAWNPASSPMWSVADAIVERIVQLGFSIIEVAINAIYAVSLIQTLRLKSSVRQRQVMWDLVYVNAMAVAFDTLNIILVYVNRVGVSRPIQTFTYALKLRLEFIVLNQLMAVAANKLRRPTFGEKRYHRPSENDWSFDMGPTSGAQGKAPSDAVEKLPSDASERAILEAAAPMSVSIQRSLSPKDVGLPGDNGSPLQSHPCDGYIGRHSRYDIAGLEDTFATTGNDTPADQQKAHLVLPRQRINRLWKNEDDEPEEEAVGLHEWEKQARPALEVPWLPCTVDV
ncbi:MAG: hypothetical protein Q9220_007579 [cf. Caloplaca sp. 1 TL-2023]